MRAASRTLRTVSSAASSLWLKLEVTSKRELHRQAGAGEVRQAVVQVAPASGHGLEEQREVDPMWERLRGLVPGEAHLDDPGLDQLAREAGNHPVDDRWGLLRGVELTPVDGQRVPRALGRPRWRARRRLCPHSTERGPRETRSHRFRRRTSKACACGLLSSASAPTRAVGRRPATLVREQSVRRGPVPTRHGADGVTGSRPSPPAVRHPHDERVLPQKLPREAPLEVRAWSGPSGVGNTKVAQPRLAARSFEDVGEDDLRAAHPGLVRRIRAFGQESVSPSIVDTIAVGESS